MFSAPDRLWKILFYQSKYCVDRTQALISNFTIPKILPKIKQLVMNGLNLQALAQVHVVEAFK